MRIRVQETDSTNRIARERIADGALPGTLVWAESQVAGKGQYGRSFVSPPGGLYFSLVLQPGLPPESLPLVTLATGLACRDVLSAELQVEPMIKWPNDLYLGEKKVAGILCENIVQGTGACSLSTVIIGVGINVNTRIQDFPAEVQSLVTTVFEHTQHQADLETLLDLLVTRIQRMVDLLHDDKETVLGRWQHYDYLFDKPLRYIRGSECVLGRGKGVTTSGTYRFVDAQGREREIIGGQLRPCTGKE